MIWTTPVVTNIFPSSTGAKTFNKKITVVVKILTYLRSCNRQINTIDYKKSYLKTADDLKPSFKTFNLFNPSKRINLSATIIIKLLVYFYYPKNSR